MLELFEYIKKLNIKIKFLSSDIFAGEYASAFKGRGLEFEEVREYIVGDDIKSIDWNTTAKTGKLHTKVYREERELTAMIVLDTSTSMNFGSKWALKAELATEIAALFSYTAIKNNDKVGLILFDKNVHTYISPKKGRNHIWHIIKTIVNNKNHNKETNISEALKFLSNTIKKKSIAFVISDFISKSDFITSFKSLKKTFDFVPVVISDPLEEKFNASKRFVFNYIDSESENNYKGYINFSSNLKNYIIRDFRRINIFPINIFTDKPYLPEIVKYFRARRKTL